MYRLRVCVSVYAVAAIHAHAYHLSGISTIYNLSLYSSLEIDNRYIFMNFVFSIIVFTYLYHYFLYILLFILVLLCVFTNTCTHKHTHNTANRQFFSVSLKSIQPAQCLLMNFTCFEAQSFCAVFTIWIQNMCATLDTHTYTTLHGNVIQLNMCFTQFQHNHKCQSQISIYWMPKSRKM